MSAMGWALRNTLTTKDVYKIYQMGEETVHALTALTVDPGSSYYRGLFRLRVSPPPTSSVLTPTSGNPTIWAADVRTTTSRPEIRQQDAGLHLPVQLIPKLNVLENVELFPYAGVSAAAPGERAIRSRSGVGPADKCKTRPASSPAVGAAAGVHRPRWRQTLAGDPGRRAHWRPGLLHRPGGAGPSRSSTPRGMAVAFITHDFHRCQGQAHCAPGRGRKDHL